MGRSPRMRPEEGYVVLAVSKSMLHRLLMQEFGGRLKVLNLAAARMGYYIKPFHVVYKKSPRGELEYRYYGKYWYRIERKGGKRLLKYVGTSTGVRELDGVRLGIEGFSFVAYRFSETPVFLRRSVTDSFRWLLLRLCLLPQTP